MSCGPLRKDVATARRLIAAVAFPSAMVDRIAPAVTQADLDSVERVSLRDTAVVVGEPFRQRVIEQKFAGRMPRWDLVGATSSAMSPCRAFKMRVLRAQTTLHARRAGRPRHTFDAIADPLLATLPHACGRDAADAHAGARHGAAGLSNRASAACATPQSAIAITRSPPTVRRRSRSACSIRSAIA
jgi:hypothetical protein